MFVCLIDKTINNHLQIVMINSIDDPFSFKCFIPQVKG